MRKSKSWAPSRGGAACADTPEGRDGCCCDADTPGAGDSCAVDDNKLSCSVASIQIERGFTGLTRTSSATPGGSEHGKLLELFHEIKCRLHMADGWLQRLLDAGGFIAWGVEIKAARRAVAGNRKKAETHSGPSNNPAVTTGAPKCKDKDYNARKGNKESSVRDSRQHHRWILIFECAHASEKGEADKDPDQQEALSPFEAFFNRHVLFI